MMEESSWEGWLTMFSFVHQNALMNKLQWALFLVVLCALEDLASLSSFHLLLQTENKLSSSSVHLLVELQDPISISFVHQPAQTQN